MESGKEDPLSDGSLHIQMDWDKQQPFAVETGWSSLSIFLTDFFFFNGFEFKLVCSRFKAWSKKSHPSAELYLPTICLSSLDRCLVGWLVDQHRHVFPCMNKGRHQHQFLSIGGDCFLHVSSGIEVDLAKPLLAGLTSASHFHARNQTSLSFTFSQIDIFKAGK